MTVSETLLQKRILFFGGKGGVGKTTTASAFALLAANEGRKTLLVSTDPAHSIGDIFAMRIGDKGVRLAENLTGIEIDPEEQSRRYIEGVKKNIRKVVDGERFHEIEHQIDLARVSPGADEAALFDRLVDIVRESDKEYDLVIFDTAPTGHTVRLLSLPELMSAWIDGMLQRRQRSNRLKATWLNATSEPAPVDDPVYDALQNRRRRFHEARLLLLDPARTAFVFVLIPEKLPILETGKAIHLLDHYGVPVSALVVNRVLPEEADGEFLARRRRQEAEHLQEIQTVFERYPRVQIPLFPEDVRGKEALLQVTRFLRPA